MFEKKEKKKKTEKRALVMFCQETKVRRLPVVERRSRSCRIVSLVKFSFVFLHFGGKNLIKNPLKFG